MKTGLKRCLDILLSTSVLVAFGPFMALIAFAVWWDSGRPVLFRQLRVGKHFRRFHILKFRTMRVESGPSITIAGDHRITRVGRWLRSTKLDELPQFLNVLRGDMSLVGPRPEVPEYVELFKERFRRVLAVRPGITDIASIQFRDEQEILCRSTDPLKHYTEAVLPSKLSMAERYVDTYTVWGDIAVLFKTALVLAKPPNRHVSADVNSPETEGSPEVSSAYRTGT